MRSGAGVLGSIPGALVIAGAFVVLSTIRYKSLKITLKVPSESNQHSPKEAPMEDARIMLSSTLETIWALAISNAAGLLLLS